MTRSDSTPSTSRPRTGTTARSDSMVNPVANTSRTCSESCLRCSRMPCLCASSVLMDYSTAQLLGPSSSSASSSAGTDSCPTFVRLTRWRFGGTPEIRGRSGAPLPRNYAALVRRAVVGPKFERLDIATGLFFAPVDLLDLVVVRRLVRETREDSLDERLLVAVFNVTQEFVRRLCLKIAECRRKRSDVLITEVAREDNGLV